MTGPLTPHERRARITQLLHDIRAVQDEHGLRRKRTTLERMLGRRPRPLPPAARKRMLALAEELGHLLALEAEAKGIEW